jgi:hypothetical protein
MFQRRWGWVMLLFANVLAWSMLGFHSRSGAAPQEVRAPFDNAVQQRGEMIRELQEIKALLREQNGLLRAGAKSTNAPDSKKRT